VTPSQHVHHGESTTNKENLVIRDVLCVAVLKGMRAQRKLFGLVERES
jgi:hypothetical protein